MPFDGPLGGSPCPPIADCAFLSDRAVTALVAWSGNVGSMGLPRMDGPRSFGSMLDRVAGGFRFDPIDASGFRLHPIDVNVPAARRYRPGTIVPETSSGTQGCWNAIRDVRGGASR
jgi:hypothetical protein